MVKNIIIIVLILTLLLGAIYYRKDRCDFVVNGAKLKDIATEFCSFANDDVPPKELFRIIFNPTNESIYHQNNE